MTAKEVHEFLDARGRVEAYPLFNVVVRLFLQIATLC